MGSWLRMSGNIPLTMTEEVLERYDITDRYDRTQFKKVYEDIVMVFKKAFGFEHDEIVLDVGFSVTIQDHTFTHDIIDGKMFSDFRMVEDWSHPIVSLSFYDRYDTVSFGLGCIRRVQKELLNQGILMPLCDSEVDDMIDAIREKTGLVYFSSIAHLSLFLTSNNEDVLHFSERGVAVIPKEAYDLPMIRDYTEELVAEKIRYKKLTARFNHRKPTSRKARRKVQRRQDTIITRGEE